jgi:hypothetical protein
VPPGKNGGEAAVAAPQVPLSKNGGEAAVAAPQVPAPQAHQNKIDRIIEDLFAGKLPPESVPALFDPVVKTAPAQAPPPPPCPPELTRRSADSLAR